MSGGDGMPQEPLRCRFLGAGPPLVLLHGWAMSSAVWRHQEQLADRYRLILPDLPGHGQWRGVTTEFTLQRAAAALAATFRQYQLTGVTLLGWSLGGSVAMSAIPLLEERVSSLILVGGTPRFLVGEGYHAGLPAQQVRGMSLRLRRGYQRTMEEFFRSMFADGEIQAADLAAVYGLLAGSDRLPEPALALSALEALATADLRRLLPELSLPTLVLHGTEDHICPPDAGRALAEGVLRGELTLLPGLGHAPFISQPQLFNRLVREFCEAQFDRH